MIDPRILELAKLIEARYILWKVGGSLPDNDKHKQTWKIILDEIVRLSDEIASSELKEPNSYKQPALNTLRTMLPGWSKGENE